MKSFANLLSSLARPGKGTDRVVGVDMGTSSIKVVEVQNRNDVLTLTTYGEIQLGPYGNKAVGESLTLDVKQEQQALVDILRESAVKANAAVFAMPLSSSFVTSIHFEVDAKEDLGPRVRVEARKYIPVPINDVTLDWAEINPPASKKGDKRDSGQRDVLIAAIQNEALNRFKDLMRFANLHEPPTEIECFSSIRAAYSNEEQHIAVFDVGALSTKLYLAHAGLLQRMHRVRVGGALATKRIAEALEMPFEEAEILKRGLTRDHPRHRDVVRAHSSCYERPLLECRQVIKEYEESVGTPVDAIYLAGGGVLFPGFRQAIADVIQAEVRMINPFKKVAHPAFMEDIISDLGPTFHVSLGAALRVYE